jgi:hypothetical protein
MLIPHEGSIIRHCLHDQTASLIAHSLISSRLDYANSVFLGAPSYVSNKLQRIQNSPVRIVLQSDSRAHSEPLLRQFNWLPEFVSSSTLSHTKPSLITLRNTFLHSSTITSRLVLFAPLISTISFPLHPVPTSVLALSAPLLLPFGIQFLLKSAHPIPSKLLNGI